MINTVHTNPLMNKGRYYTVKLESDGNDVTIVSVDADLTGVSVSGQYLKTVENFHVVDYFLDINLETVSSATTVSKGIRQYADGIQGVVIPATANFTNCTVVIYGYFE